MWPGWPCNGEAAVPGPADLRRAPFRVRSAPADGGAASGCWTVHVDTCAVVGHPEAIRAGMVLWCELQEAAEARRRWLQKG